MASKRKIGRPLKEIDKVQFEKLCKSGRKDFTTPDAVQAGGTICCYGDLPG